MPILLYACDDGHTLKKFFRRSPQEGAEFLCPKCSKPLHRLLAAPNSQSIVIVDNGYQAKAVEVNLDMVEKIREQSTKDFSQKD